MLELINVTPASSLVEHGVYIRPAASISADSFGQGRVFVMGDAAHPLRPTGQGFNQAVEDAYGLGKALAGCSSPGTINLNALQVSTLPPQPPLPTPKPARLGCTNTPKTHSGASS